MKTFLRFLFDNPFFAVCFLFYSIPFWVPLLALLNGADPVLMIAVSALSVMSKAYIDSEISFRNPIALMFKYFLANPFIVTVKFLFAAIVISILFAYGSNGAPLDAGIAALLMVYVVIKMFFSPKKNGYWNIKGLGIYRFYSFSGKFLAALLWLAFFSLDFGAADSIAVAFTALLVYGFTFFKVNEGLL